MNSQGAKIFLAIVEHRSISAAAQALYISQPAVSSHLARLEEQLGVPLVVRQRGIQGIILTPEGHNFISVARQWVAAEQSLQQFQEAQTRRTLRLGARLAAHDYLLEPIRDNLLRRDPKLDVKELIVEHRDQYAAAKERRFDVAFHFGNTAIASDFVNVIPFFMDRWCVFCPSDTPLPDRPLIAAELDPAFEICPRYVERTTKRWHQEAFPNPQSSYATVAWVMSAPWHFQDYRCWSVLPMSIALYWLEVHPGRYTLRHLAQPIQPRRCYIAVAKEYRHTNVVRTLLECCREYLEERPQLESLLPENM